MSRGVHASFEARIAGASRSPFLVVLALASFGAFLAWKLQTPALAPGGSPEAPPAEPWFVVRSAGSGLVHPTISGAKKQHWVVEMGGQGIALLDYDGDGWLDIYQPNGTTPEDLVREVYPPDRLYRNLGDGTFEDVTAKAGVGGASWSLGGFAVDYDADGDVDLYVTNFTQDELWNNRGNGVFEEVARESGIVEDDYSTSSAWGDVDGDGDLDFYLTNFAKLDIAGGHPPLSQDGKPCIDCGPGTYERVYNRLYLNDGDGRFTDASIFSGIRSPAPAYSFMGVMVDVDLDGDLDIFVANDVRDSMNYLFINQGGGHFIDEARARGVQTSWDGLDQSCMGVAIFDQDGNGYPDLGITNFWSETFTPYINQGEGFFKDMTRELGWAEPTRDPTGWGLGVFDFDHDGRLDALFNNGHISAFEPPQEGAPVPEGAVSYTGDMDYQANIPQRMRVLLLAGKERGGYEPIFPSPDPTDALHLVHSGRGAAFGDLDNDGDLDAVLARRFEPPVLLVNRAGDGKPSLRIRLEGRGPNTWGIGARVKVEAGDRHWWLFQAPHQGFQGSNDPCLHLGLAGAAAADRVTVFWPGGGEDVVGNVPAGELTIRQGQGRTAWKASLEGW